jgi:hypothetical protein
MMAQRKVTDRAHRYRANALAPSGPKVCAWCGSRDNITVDHKDGWPDRTRRSNLQYLCKSCNTAKGIAFREAGRGRPTKQYNPAEPPTFAQYAWAVSNGNRHQYIKGHGWEPGDHDEAGAIIHATPPELRSEYAQRIAASAKRTRRSRDDDRWNAAQRDNAFWDTKSTHYTRKPGGKFQKVGGFGDAYDVKAARRSSLVEARREKREAAAETRKRKREAAAETKKQKRADVLNRKFLAREAAAERKAERAKPAIQRKYEGLQRKSASVPAKRRMSDKGILAELMRNPANLVIRKVGKLWRAYRSREDANLRRNELAAAVSRDKLIDALKRRNPAAAADDGYKEFHGHDSKEWVTVKREVHTHDYLSGAGELRVLKVDGVDGWRHTIGGLKGAILAFNEDKNQLFVEGGDQFIDLKTFHISKPHEVETLGKVTALDYFTTKTHLGKEGGTAVYAHKLRTTNENGRHVVVTIARYPDLIYEVLNRQLRFSGGSYEIRAEGIDK